MFCKNLTPAVVFDLCKFRLFNRKGNDENDALNAQSILSARFILEIGIIKICRHHYGLCVCRENIMGDATYV